MSHRKTAYSIDMLFEDSGRFKEPCVRSGPGSPG